MAHSNDSIITGKLRGMLGKELVFRNWDGKTIVAKAPNRKKGKFSSKQMEIQENFLLGVKYATAIKSGANPELLEGYQAAVRPRQNAYSRALEDFVSLPKVTSITARSYRGAVGDKITVRAKDDFRVVSVWVGIYSDTGQLLESGLVQQNLNGLDWDYSATVANSQLIGTVIKAIATDVPNNEGTLEFIL